jgi:hypothetical protein
MNRLRSYSPQGSKHSGRPGSDPEGHDERSRSEAAFISLT